MTAVLRPSSGSVIAWPTGVCNGAQWRSGRLTRSKTGRAGARAVKKVSVGAQEVELNE